METKMDMRVVRKSSIPAMNRRGRKPSEFAVKALALISKLGKGKVVKINMGSKDMARKKSATIYQALRNSRAGGVSVWSGVRSSVRGSSLFLWRA